ncbi:rhodanese domain-containing protein CG4456-like [Drosophila novamexicana]|uniref:rhodanese domain-containing protein CG4456-like n=1 Tax=Drosophila novamexicana TaxID=47314 RepID=UPI0011E5A7B8|nr:rhodanese domain-containing protein CG4456-like [Drosophila novamexicana]
MLSSIFCRAKQKIPLNQGIKGVYLAYCAYCNKAPIIYKKSIVGKFHIDVRSAIDIEKTFKFPGSLNIPADQLAKALGPATSEAQFKFQFGREKPHENIELMFSCATGELARLSAVHAVALGYRNVCFYDGSCTDLLQQDTQIKIG